MKHIINKKMYFDIDEDGILVYNQKKSIENKRISILFKYDGLKLKAVVPRDAIF